MNIFFLIFSNVSFIMILLWIFLFVYLTFRVVKNKLSFSDKVLNSEKKSIFNSISHKKLFYVLLLMFLLTQFLPGTTIYSSEISNLSFTQIQQYKKFVFLKSIISIFTLFTFYLFIFAFFIIDSNKEKNYRWQVISFIILFLNLFSNLIIVPNQVLMLFNANLLTVDAFINFLFFFFIYLLILRFFLNLFRYFFNYSITHFFKLTIFIFNYKTIKDIFFKNNKVNLLVFLNQLLKVSSLIIENEKQYVLPTKENIDYLVINDFTFYHNKVEKRNLSFFITNKETMLHSKTLKDYIFINGWKMSLIQ